MSATPLRIAHVHALEGGRARPEAVPPANGAAGSREGKGGRARVAGTSVLLSAVFDPVAHAVAAVGYALPHATPERHGVKLLANVPYVEGERLHKRRHLLDIYLPASLETSRTLLPVVMYVHGGGFSSCSKDTHRVFALELARKGNIVFNINYGLGPRFRYPEPLEDAARALAWVRAHAEDLGGDPARIALAGDSAGGNLVTALALAHAFERREAVARGIYETGQEIRAVIATYPFLDLTEVETFLAHPKMPRWAKALAYDSASSYIGADLRGFTHANPLSSPLLVLERGDAPQRSLPPFFVSCGTKDPLLRQSRRLAEALESHGAPCELLVQRGEFHGSDAFLFRAAARAKWRAATAFLAKWL